MSPETSVTWKALESITIAEKLIIEIDELGLGRIHEVEMREYHLEQDGEFLSQSNILHLERLHRSRCARGL